MQWPHTGLLTTLEPVVFPSIQRRLCIKQMAFKLAWAAGLTYFLRNDVSWLVHQSVTPWPSGSGKKWRQRQPRPCMAYLGSSLGAPFSPAVDCYALPVLYWITLCSLSSFSLETNKKLTETKRLWLYECVGRLLNCYGKMMGDASKPPGVFKDGVERGLYFFLHPDSGLVSSVFSWSFLFTKLLNSQSCPYP